MYLLGRLLQIFGLILMPSAIWIAEFKKSEAGAIGIFLAALVIFYLGHLLAKFSKP